MNAILLVGVLCLMATATSVSAENQLSAPVTNAVDATRRSIIAANRAVASYTARRFIETNNMAVLTRQQWIWRGRLGHGKGDLEVIVCLRTTGELVYANVTELISLPQPGF